MKILITADSVFRLYTSTGGRYCVVNPSTGYVASFAKKTDAETLEDAAGRYVDFVLNGYKSFVLLNEDENSLRFTDVIDGKPNKTAEFYFEDVYSPQVAAAFLEDWRDYLLQANKDSERK